MARKGAWVGGLVIQGTSREVLGSVDPRMPDPGGSADKMSWRVIPVIKPDDDSVKTTTFRHERVEVDIFLSAQDRPHRNKSPVHRSRQSVHTRQCIPSERRFHLKGGQRHPVLLNQIDQ